MHHISSLNSAYALSTTQWQNVTATNRSAKFTVPPSPEAAQDEVSSTAGNGGSAPQSIVNVLQAQLTQLQGAELPQNAQIQQPIQQQSQPAAANVVQTDAAQSDAAQSEFAQMGKGAFVDVMA